MSKTIDTPSDRLTADLDLVRSLVRSWGAIDEGSVAQARAVLNGSQAIANLRQSAADVIYYQEQA